MEETVHAREGTPRLAMPEDDGAEVVKEEEEKGRIILVNALPALTSVTSRCTRSTRDQIPSKLRERTDPSRRVQLHRAVPYDGGVLPMQLEFLSVARDCSNIAAICTVRARIANISRFVDKLFDRVIAINFYCK